MNTMPHLPRQLKKLPNKKKSKTKYDINVFNTAISTLFRMMVEVQKGLTTSFFPTTSPNVGTSLQNFDF